MTRTLRALCALGSPILFAAGAVVAGPPAPRTPVVPADACSTSPGAVDERDVQPLLDRVSTLSDLINRNSQSPQVWKYLLEQADVLQQLASRSAANERENLLRMAVDCCHGAAVRSPDNETTALQRLVNLPAQLARAYPGSPVITHAAMQEVRAEYMRLLAQNAEHPEVAQDHLRRCLAQFARDYSETPEAPQAILEAAQLSETLGKIDDARRCYRYLIEKYPGQPVARKAGGSLWRLGMDGEQIGLALPQLFVPAEREEQLFDLGALHGKCVVVYFWSSTSPQAAADFQVLKHLTDRFQFRGLETVYVNMDAEPAQARTFLSGILTAGTHLYQRGGFDGPVAERYGIQTLPQVFLIGKDGKLVSHSLGASQLEAEVAGRLGGR